MCCVTLLWLANLSATNQTSVSNHDINLAIFQDGLRITMSGKLDCAFWTVNFSWEIAYFKYRLSCLPKASFMEST